ncbi:hypothetical protein PHYBLDRAFT_157047 [Phycomyces blakesleeanus NRRL 1555(-)]|uniref:Uncharacterized protein n=1 Tax=Phycomyces blakesleeanus (strain ATCC 8743b / DSM 1359 / FGSC 10004 / NBRC 33097 / NRRL 1555) TaxID=763407 RepID=A0A162V9J7_PHYB8|nr:hypothetical protein PHYBLDRAFT_157047 [Phycomyces blakesleeanus NRRL 1555(-)]OAD81022.1 hypothetical protein PHYBLDRAFT_157047 [Phycomyces blakesleeanus NRRL 1555(-)]|eukprot:XP_018299062.1 hypothetical protein PHYBLDRAFT_157047 [Phycomyces blakesleeanus NRRL 1555(-)]
MFESLKIIGQMSPSCVDPCFSWTRSQAHFRLKFPYPKKKEIEKKTMKLKKLP